MNELTYSRGITGKQSWLLKTGQKKRNNYQFNGYNQLKQEWDEKVARLVTHQGFTPVEACYFNYLVVESTKKRDPSNVFASAIKFIEDGLKTAKVIPNDGWKNVLGIRPEVVHMPDDSDSVMLVMADRPLERDELILEYENWKRTTTELSLRRSSKDDTEGSDKASG